MSWSWVQVQQSCSLSLYGTIDRERSREWIVKCFWSRNLPSDWLTNCCRTTIPLQLVYIRFHHGGRDNGGTANPCPHIWTWWFRWNQFTTTAEDFSWWIQHFPLSNISRPNEENRLLCCSMLRCPFQWSQSLFVDGAVASSTLEALVAVFVYSCYIYQGDDLFCSWSRSQKRRRWNDNQGRSSSPHIVPLCIFGFSGYQRKTSEKKNKERDHDEVIHGAGICKGGSSKSEWNGAVFASASTWHHKCA